MHTNKLLFLSATVLGSVSLSAQTTIFSDTFGGSGAIEGTTADTNVGNASAEYVVVISESLNDDNWIESGGALTWNYDGGTNANTANNRIYNDITLAGGTTYEFTATLVPGAAGSTRIGLGRTTSYLSVNYGFAISFFSGDAQFNYWNGTANTDGTRIDLNWDRDQAIRMTITYDAENQTVSADVENLVTSASATVASSITLSGWDPEADLQYVQYQVNAPTDGAASLAIPSLQSVEVTAIPEPGAYGALLSLAAFGWMMLRRRR